MIRLVQRRLIVPRGDTGTFSIPILAGKDSGDAAIFTVFDPLMHRKIFEKEMSLSDGALGVDFTHNDTVNLPVGQYVWDIKFYTDPLIVDGKLVGGTEVDSYYSAFTLPICEIRETGDNLLMSDDAPTGALRPGQVDIITASIREITSLKQSAAESAANADTSATNAEGSASAAATSAQDALDSKVAALAAQQTASAASESATSAAANAQASATLAAQRADQVMVELGTKANIEDLAAVAFSGLYSDLSGVPTRVSQFINDAGYLTQHQDISGKANLADLATVAVSGSYNDLEDKPTIPDIQIEGTSIVNNGIANIPKANSGVYGLITISDAIGETGITSEEDRLGHLFLRIFPATEQLIKTGANVPMAISPNKQHISTFYGLAKAAGDSTQSISANAVGTYTNAAKEAIQTMLDVPSKADIPTKVSDLTDDSGHYTKPVGGIPASDLAAGVLDVWSGLTYHTSTMSTDSDSFVLGGATDAPTEINKCLVTSTPNANVIPKFDYQGRLHSVTPEEEWDGSNAVATTEYVDNMISDNMPEVPTNVSELTNDAGYITGYTETDPTVPAWAKAVQKPTYTAAEVGAPTVQEMNDAIAAVNTMKLHICTQNEYNSETGIPTVQEPDTQTFYLVPGGDSNNLFIEWAYVNNAWERFGSADVDLSNYVQKTDYATNSTAGIVKVNNETGADGIAITASHKIILSKATVDEIKAGTNNYKPIVSSTEDKATFYGLAKAAGDITQKVSTNATGTYTPEAKEAIQQMLDVPSKGDIPEVPVQDVQINETSILNSGIANIPIASDSNFGVIKTNVNHGIGISNNINYFGELVLNNASSTDIKTGTNMWKPLAPVHQHESVFYGLAKAAGDTTQNVSTNAIGTYTNEAKEAIQTMLGVTNALASKLDAAEAGLKVVRLI